MAHSEYTAVPLSDAEGIKEPKRHRNCDIDSTVKILLLVAVTAITSYFVGFAVGQTWDTGGELSSWPSAGEDGLLPPQSFLPPIPKATMKFTVGSIYENTSMEADKAWNELMPLGAGFVRVPYPRRFDMPESKIIENDTEEGETYSLSGMHQLHCLYIVRDVIKKYEKKDRSRFAGGHEYHCIDYIRQAIMCAGDTTLDFAEPVVGVDGVERRIGFSGANAIHQCRDWDVIKKWATENRSGDKATID